MEGKADVWADALAEVENVETRNAGLWAKCFAESDGDEARAKAAYIKNRVEQLTPKPTTGYCPNCNYQLSLKAEACPNCKALFDGTGWAPTLSPQGQGVQQAPSGTRHGADSRPQPQLVKSAKSRGVYIILGLFFGLLGIHNFYAGRYAYGVMQLLITGILGWFVVGLFITAIWVIVEMITVTKDGEGDPMS